MIRRAFLFNGLALLGFDRRIRPQPATPSPRYAPLAAPVRIALDAVRSPWQPVSFKAEAVVPPARRVLISGVVFRRVTADGRADVTALCVTCTHEQCQVDFVAEPTALPRTDRVVTHPVFLCPCHSSVFDASDEGTWIAGPAPRGLFRFHTRIDGDAVEIDGVEEEALSAV